MTSRALLKWTSSIGPRLALHVVSKSTAAVPLTQSPVTEIILTPGTKSFSEMPGDSGWPFIGVIDLITKASDGKAGAESYFHEVHAKYGPVARLKAAGGQWIVFANEPEAAEAMFRAEGKYPTRFPLMENAVLNIHKAKKWPAPLLFALNEDWKRIRSAMSKQVIPRRVGNLTEPLCMMTDELFHHVESISSQSHGRVEDLTEIITKWAFQNTAYFVFGEHLDVYDTSNLTHQEFITAGLEFVKQIGLINPLPIYKYFPSLAYRSFIEASSKMRKLGHQIMEKKAVQWSEDIARGTVDETKSVGILEQWLIEGKLELEEALTQACDLLAAGLDTTKNTAIFMLYELAKQPALQDQLCYEIKAVLGDKVNPSWEDLQSIPLVRNCLKETLRLYPAIRVNARQIQSNAVIGGYEVPAGTVVINSNGQMSLNKKYYDEPLKFIPERWSKNKEAIHPFTSLPFGFGQRGCYGRRLAELEIYILLTKLIPRFTLSTDKDSITLFQGTVLKPNEPVPIIFKKK